MNKKRVLSSLCLTLGISMLFTSSVFAYAGGQSGGGGAVGCPGTLCTSWGATWQWYKWGENVGGVVFNGDSVTIKGDTDGSSENGYAVGVSNDAELNRCKELGGFYRYAMVAYKDGSYDDGSRYRAGDQVGVIGISGNWSSTFNSEYFNGGMMYIGSDWDDVKNAFENGPEWSKNGHKWKSGDDLAWFCHPGPNDNSPVTFFSSSQSSNRVSIMSEGDDEWNYTNIKSATDYDRAVSSSLSLVLENGTTDVAHLTFSHNVYASKPNADIPYTIRRTWKKEDGGTVHSGFDSNNSYYTLEAPSASSTNSGLRLTSQSTADSTSGTAKSSSERADDIHYTGGEQNYTDNPSEAYRYILRDYYEVVFKETGKYFFTETVYINGVAMTSATTVITVRTRTNQEDDLNQCEKWTPGSYDRGVTSVISKVKNSTLDESWSDRTYAKPNDSLDWIHCYYPGVQSEYDDTVSWSHPNSNHRSCVSTTSMSYTIISNKISSWGNYFKVTQDNIKEYSGLPYESERYSFGDTTIRMFEDTRFSRTRQAGEYLAESASTSKPIDVYIESPENETIECEHSCTDENGEDCSWTEYWDAHEDDYIGYDYDSGPATDSADVGIPYNFINTVHVKINDQYAYSGESITLKPSGTYTVVGQRRNNALDGTYATEVDDATVGLITYVMSGRDTGGAIADWGGSPCNAISGDIRCDDSFKTITDLNTSGNMTGEKKEAITLTKENGPYNVYDYEAGYYFCVRATINPYTVDGDYDMDKSGSGTWYISEPDCRIIAKRPTFQVYGGSLYSAGNVKTTAAVKANVGNRYDVTEKKKTTVFGSWVEESTVALGSVEKLASGAANAINEGGDRYCAYRTPISFANYTQNKSALRVAGMCSSGGYIGATGHMSKAAKATLNPRSIVDYWFVPNERNKKNVDNNSTVDIVSKYSIADKNIGKTIRYTYGTGNYTITASRSLDNGASQIVLSDKSITIASNITYDRGLAHTSIGDIPKLIIYAAEDVNIKCGVNRIDAIILASGKVNTCSDSAGIDSQKNSNQLTVNGMIISGYLYLNRTYGGGAGEAASKTPAEIINYDTSTLLWGKIMTNSDDSNNNFTVTYQHELAPRY